MLIGYEYTSFFQAVQFRHTLLSYVYTKLDDLRLQIEKYTDDLLQNMLHNSWINANNVTNTLVSAPKGL